MIMPHSEKYLPCCSEKYLGVFPPALFLCQDSINYMHFILSLKHTQREELDSRLELLQHCGAHISFDIKDASDYSVIIVDHNDVVNFKAPAFKFKYFEECLKRMKLLQISDDQFRQRATRHIARDVDCMEVVFFRKKTWTTVLSEAEKKWFDGNNNGSKTPEELEPLSPSNSGNILNLVQERLALKRGLESEPDDGLETDQKVPHSRKTLELSNDDDSSLEESQDCVIEEEKEEEISGQRIDLTRSPEKAKKSNNVEAERCDSKADKRWKNSSVVATTSNKESQVQRNESRTSQFKRQDKSETSKQKWRFLDDFDSSSDNEDSNSVKGEKKKKFFDFKAADEDLFSKAKDKKHSRLPYSHNEQSLILKYIVERNEFSRIKGRELWMIMERRKICPNRTWQSMKEHFLKKIWLNLDAYDFLSESDKMKIKSFSC